MSPKIHAGQIADRLQELIPIQRDLAMSIVLSLIHLYLDELKFFFYKFCPECEAHMMMSPVNTSGV